MTLREIEKQIKALQVKADKLKSGKDKGLKVVLAAMKEHGLTVDDIITAAAGKATRRGQSHDHFGVSPIARMIAFS